MSTTMTGMRVRQGLILLVMLSALTVLGAAMLAGSPSSNAGSEAAPQLSETELAVTGEVVMIEGNVQFVEDPFSNEKDAYLVMEYLYIAQAAGNQAIEFHVNEKTLMDEDLKVGDTVEVVAEQNGEALSVKKAE